MSTTKTIDKPDAALPQPVPIAKRLADFCGSAVLATLAAPLLGVVAVAVKATSSGPVFFRQTRVGKDGRPFRVFKFRTMCVDAENKGLGLSVAANDDRITRIGHFLRNSSLDELPQLFNVLRGEMSLVGPRPTVPSQVERYTDYQRQRLLVRPGLTGWAQVNGRNSLSWPERIEKDVWYVQHWSLLLDLRILLRTARVVIRRDGLYGEGGLVRDEV